MPGERELPPVAYYALRPVKAGRLHQVGEIVPGASAWRNIAMSVSQGEVAPIPTRLLSDEEKEQILRDLYPDDYTKSGEKVGATVDPEPEPAPEAPVDAPVDVSKPEASEDAKDDGKPADGHTDAPADEKPAPAKKAAAPKSR